MHASTKLVRVHNPEVLVVELQQVRLGQFRSGSVCFRKYVRLGQAGLDECFSNFIESQQTI